MSAKLICPVCSGPRAADTPSCPGCGSLVVPVAAPRLGRLKRAASLGASAAPPAGVVRPSALADPWATPASKAGPVAAPYLVPSARYVVAPDAVVAPDVFARPTTFAEHVAAIGSRRGPIGLSVGAVPASSVRSSSFGTAPIEAPRQPFEPPLQEYATAAGKSETSENLASMDARRSLEATPPAPAVASPQGDVFVPPPAASAHAVSAPASAAPPSVPPMAPYPGPAASPLGPAAAASLPSAAPPVPVSAFTPASAAVAQAVPPPVPSPVVSGRPVAAIPAVAVPGESRTSGQSGSLIRDFATFGFVVAGASLGFASFFLPWASDGGLAIGVQHNYGPDDRWGWAAPATPILLVVMLLVVFSPIAADRLGARFPRGAEAYVRLTEVALPMVLAGTTLGVSLLYVTLPYGSGSGPLLDLLGGVLVFVGAFVALLFPEHDAAH